MLNNASIILFFLFTQFTPVLPIGLFETNITRVIANPDTTNSTYKPSSFMSSFTHPSQVHDEVRILKSLDVQIEWNCYLVILYEAEHVRKDSSLPCQTCGT